VVSSPSGREKKMHSAPWSVPAVSLLFVSSLCSVATHSQTAQFLSREAGSFRFTSLSPATKPCERGSDSAPGAPPTGTSRAAGTFATCDHSPENDLPLAPCNPAIRTATGCIGSRDSVRDDLNTLGKQGQKILLARQKVLEILQTENACTEWYRSKDTDPAATFRTLTFVLDRQGEAYVRDSNEAGGMDLIRSPYVASVIQDQGPYATVTINVNGAFFYSMAHVVKGPKEGGTLNFQGARLLRVGPYAGGTLHAQILALLHEFGHVTDLLPPDWDDYEGKSRQNTAEVLRFCRGEVESRETQNPFLASR
jgi:hypothetical protein